MIFFFLRKWGKFVMDFLFFFVYMDRVGRSRHVMFLLSGDIMAREGGQREGGILSSSIFSTHRHHSHPVVVAAAAIRSS